MINIAIDGHVSSGKSTLAKGLAKKLDFKVFDTGAVYRGLACEFRKQSLNKIDEDTIKKFISNVLVEVRFIDGIQHVFVNGDDKTPYLRTEEISALSAKISPFHVLREKVLDIQRDFAKNNNCVMEGRDIGTIVLPDADFKFFVTANPEVRAERRYLQVKDSCTYEHVLKELKARDYADEHRSEQDGRLKLADDGIFIDTSGLTLEQGIEKLYDIVKNNLKGCDINKVID